MNAEIAVALTLLLPIAAATTAVALAGSGGERNAPVVLAALAAVAAGAACWYALDGAAPEWRGFAAGIWPAILATGALLCVTAGVARSGTPSHAAAVCVAGGLGAASLFGSDALWVGLPLFATGAAAATTLVLAPGPAAGRLRAFAPVAASDVLILAGLVFAARSSLSIDRVGGLAAWLLLAGGAVRLGLVPGTLAALRRAGAGAVAEGPLRAQGALVCAVAAGASGRHALALAAAGAAAAFGATLSARGRRADVLVVPGAIAAVGLGVGGAPATLGAIVALAGGFAASAASLAGARSVARAALGMAPVTATFAGAALVGGAAARLAAARVEYLPVALGVLAGAVAAAAAAWRDDAGETTGKPTRTGAVVVGLLAIVALGAVAFAPAEALERVVAPAAATMGVAEPLAGIPEAPQRDLGLVFGALALAGLVAGGDARRRDHAVPEPAAVEEPAGEPPRAWLVGLGIAEGVALAFAVALFVLAGTHGWL